MRRRHRRGKRSKEESPEVSMSPLIDCVFLLLVFFLATTMLKKKEKQIPVNMPDMNLSSSKEPTPEIQVVAMGPRGNFYTLGARQTNIGRVTYKKIRQTLPDYLTELGAVHPAGAPIRLDVPRETRFALIVELLDLFQEKQFDNVSLRLLDEQSSKKMLRYSN
ncbi:biopolymer transporter ExbD [Verrucomicrobiaceae bacterium N1E253]|uniref:Biopolymer transporter ExbD n=1 Tax=Oceaniferula marina TaxID=2748318 RepID=A0A851GHJ2_9BACT|nr:biopolymer transporter ExbD [Oceaniferula marina]NWK56669.1 biopolymer transporter ExbD [Oceaniferula marina]